MMIDGIPNRPLYFYQKDSIGYIWVNDRLRIHIDPGACSDSMLNYNGEL